MNANEIIQFISNSEKKTPVKVYIKEKKPLPFEELPRYLEVGGQNRFWRMGYDIKLVIEQYAE